MKKYKRIEKYTTNIQACTKDVIDNICSDIPLDNPDMIESHLIHRLIKLEEIGKAVKALHQYMNNIEREYYKGENLIQKEMPNGCYSRKDELKTKIS